MVLGPQINDPQRNIPKQYKKTPDESGSLNRQHFCCRQKHMQLPPSALMLPGDLPSMTKLIHRSYNTLVEIPYLCELYIKLLKM